MDHYAVVGNPVSHSKSPLIHQMFAEQTSQQMSYGRIELPLDGFDRGIKGFFASADNKGLNVTVPFKEQAFLSSDVLSERARRAGAVNTLRLNSEGRLLGDTTDGTGLVRDIMENHGIDLAGKKILVVGAGGAVRGVLEPILEARPAALTICNRTPEKLEPLIEAFGSLGALTKSAFVDLGAGYDVIINGTSASLGGQLPALPECVISRTSVVYDMMYSNETTPFNHWASQLGASKVLDGLGMLVEQAAEAFFLWRGVRPNTAEVMQVLRHGQSH